MTYSKPPRERDERQEQKKWYGRMWVQILLFAGGIALFVLVGGWILDWYINPRTSTQKQDLVQALGLITAGVAGAVGIFFTWRGQSLARETQEHNQSNTQEQLKLSRESQKQNQKSTQAQLKNAQEELRLTRQGQITERFTRAIEQLGATDGEGEKKLEIRLGGIYALERIDKESPERAYHGTVMEVLTAYVRENSRWEPEEASIPTPAPTDDTERDKEGVEQAAELTPRRLPTDIIAILDVLKRREEERVPEKHRVLLDLRGANLEGADLQGAHLQEAHFQDANLEGAFLDSSIRVLPSGPLMKGAAVHLENADLSRAHLRKAKLGDARLEGAILIEASLELADLYGAHLESAALYKTSLEAASLEGTHLEGTDLSGAQRLTQEQVNVATGDANTMLPNGLRVPPEWEK